VSGGPPPCTALGPQCRALRLTVRVSDLEEDDPASQDALATWLLGHTERITFGRPFVEHGQRLVHVVVRVGCKYLQERGRTGEREGGRECRCRAHGFMGVVRPLEPHRRPELRHGGDRFTVVQDGRVRALALPPTTPPRRSLPVVHHGANPCATARCRTAENTVGAACCRDLTLDVVVPLGDDATEALLRSRRSPYLCKVKRADETIVECEVISACGYLMEDGIHCGLHGRVRPDSEPAKPGLCSDWPDFDDEEYSGHPGCVFLKDTGGRT
jgi:hypothetical protein